MAVRELSAEHVSGEQIRDCHQVKKSFLQRDGGDDGRPDPLHCPDLLELHQIGIRWDVSPGMVVWGFW